MTSASCRVYPTMALKRVKNNKSAAVEKNYPIELIILAFGKMIEP